MTVRAVVEDIKKFNTSGTLCWLLANEQSGGGGGARDGMGDFGSTQRVFAHCAKAVFDKVEAAVALAAIGRGVLPPTQVWTPGDNLEQWLADHNLAAFLAPLQTLGVHVLEDLAFGVAEGDITVDSLVAAGAKSRLQARRLLQAAAAQWQSKA
jgi:hypothetical protein